MFCLNCDYVLIMSLFRGRFCLHSTGFSSLFYCYFCRDIEYSSSSFIPGISLYRGLLYRGPLYKVYQPNYWEMLYQTPKIKNGSWFCSYLGKRESLRDAHTYSTFCSTLTFCLYSVFIRFSLVSWRPAY